MFLRILHFLSLKVLNKSNGINVTKYEFYFIYFLAITMIGCVAARNNNKK